MEFFCGSELAFGNSYFKPVPTNVLRVNTGERIHTFIIINIPLIVLDGIFIDLPVKTLVSAEVPPSAGSFVYPQRGLQNRFILW
jgi:hypothetical protein